jgi:hypothetical protein
MAESQHDAAPAASRVFNASAPLDLLKAVLAFSSLISDSARVVIRPGFPNDFAEDLFPRLNAPAS